MSKPENIPQDIWDRAVAVVHEIGESEEHDTLPIAVAMMDVVKVERQGCVAVVAGFIQYNVTPHGTAINPYVDAQKIIAAIRRRGV